MCGTTRSAGDDSHAGDAEGDMHGTDMLGECRPRRRVISRKALPENGATSELSSNLQCSPSSLRESQC